MTQFKVFGRDMTFSNEENGSLSEGFLLSVLFVSLTLTLGRTIRWAVHL